MATQRLDNNLHADLKLRTGYGPEQGDPVGQVAVYPGEFVPVQREYPILFLREGADGAKVLQPVAILGLSGDANLFVADGNWQAHYVPAMVRRGPLMIGRGGNADVADPPVLIDLDHPRIAGKSEEGFPLFLEQGGMGPALENGLDALRIIHTGHEMLPELTRLFDKHGLTEPLALNIQLSAEQVVKFEGFGGVTMEKIAGLGGAALNELNKAGLLDLAILAAHSLGNLNQLAARARALD